METRRHRRGALRRIAGPRRTVGRAARRDSFEASSPIPDVAFYAQGKQPPSDWMRFPPDIAIEVLSPGQRVPDIRSKIDSYLAFGVLEVWVFDPANRAVEIFQGNTRQRVADGDTLTTASAPRLRISLTEFFDRAGL